MSGKPKASGGNSSGAQILSTVQEILELTKNLDTRITTLEDRSKDHTALLESLEKKIDSSRLAATAKSRGGTKGTTKKDDEKKPAVPSINMWFRQLWKSDPEGTIEQYCDADNAAAAEAAVKKNPSHAKKEGDALLSAIAGFYYTKHFAKPASADHEAENRKKLAADHTAMKEALEKGDGDGDGDADGDAADE
jgi:hypothetical protein